MVGFSKFCTEGIFLLRCCLFIETELAYSHGMNAQYLSLGAYVETYRVGHIAIL